MKKKTISVALSAFFVLLTALSFAQPSNKINYQAVARLANGDVINTQTIGLRLTVENGPGGPIIYQERHTPATNQFGLITVQIGGGIVLSGVYNNIDWTMANLYLLVDMDPAGGTSYTTMGESQLLSVPYANYALSTSIPNGTSGQTLRSNGTNWLANSALYNNGINVGVGTSTPAGKLHVKGSADISQLVVDANGTQSNSNPIIKLRNSSGADLLWLNSNDTTNVFLGIHSGEATTTGYANTLVGNGTGMSITTGNRITAIGSEALKSHTTGILNTAVGMNALRNNTEGDYNLAIGNYALYNNVAGSGSIAIGDYAMFNANNSSTAFDSYNTAVGYYALYGSGNPANNTGQYNTALGFESLRNNSSGILNSAFGYRALYTNTTGNENVHVGKQSGNFNLSGSRNTGVGVNTLHHNPSGNDNTAIGFFSGIGNTGVIYTSCTFVGASTFPTVARTNVTMLGYQVQNGQCTADNQICLGNTAITQIRAQVTGITAYSDARIKTDVKENVSGLAFINKLKPVTYNERPEVLHQIWGTPDSLHKDIDHSQINNTRFIGFLAQDVEKAAGESGFDFPGIDVPKESKEVYALRYTDFIMPLVKAVQELSAENKELKAQVDALMAKEAMKASLHK